MGTRTALAALAVLATVIAPSMATADLVYDRESSISGVFELKLGRYTPDIDSEFGGAGPYDEVFGNRNPLLIEAEYGHHIWRGVGALGIFGAVGVNRVTGRARTADGERSPDKTRLMLIPLRAGVVYRFDYLQERWGVPFVIAAKLGLDYYVWTARDDVGIAEHVDADGFRSTGRGGTMGWHAAVGGYFLLDFLAPQMAAAFETNAGVNNTYLFAELLMARVDDFGSARSWDLSDTAVLFGLALEF